MVELATVVNFKDANHKRKCSAKKNPDPIRKYQSRVLILRNSLRFFQTIGSIKITIIHNRYILKIEDGAEDIFTKTAANEMAIMETANGSAIDFSCFKVVLPLSL